MIQWMATQNRTGAKIQLCLTPEVVEIIGDSFCPILTLAGQECLVKIEGLLEPVVLNLSFRVRSNAMFTSERRY